MCYPETLSETKQRALAAELQRIPARHRADALQEAWVASLEGRDPVQAAKTYAVRELRHEQREPALGLLL